MTIIFSNNSTGDNAVVQCESFSKRGDFFVIQDEWDEYYIPEQVFGENGIYNEFDITENTLGMSVNTFKKCSTF